MTPDMFRIWLDHRWAAGIVPMQFVLLSGVPLALFYCIDAAFLAANLSRLFAWGGDGAGCDHIDHSALRGAFRLGRDLFCPGDPAMATAAGSVGVAPPVVPIADLRTLSTPMLSLSARSSWERYSTCRICTRHGCTRCRPFSCSSPSAWLFISSSYISFNGDR
ncbi:MAG: hypothetical protein WDN69_18895 [Aliidongia sp.]